jgi:acyl carrier protein
MTTDTDATMAEILSVVLKRPVAPGEELRRADEPRWDSLRHLEIVFAAEAAFGVSFTSEEIAAIDGVAALKRKISAPDAA